MASPPPRPLSFTPCHPLSAAKGPEFPAPKTRLLRDRIMRFSCVVPADLSFSALKWRVQIPSGEGY